MTRQSSHWGDFDAVLGADGELTINAAADDLTPSPLLGNVAANLRQRIDRPYARRAWLQRVRAGLAPCADASRGSDDYVALEWPEAIELAANELRRVISLHGNTAIYGGSYGWGSAGRFHHAQSQIHRFLNTLGGYTSSRQTYSLGTARVLFEHVLGDDRPLSAPTSWPALEGTELFICFGGMPAKNAGVNAGGVGRHETAAHLRRARGRGARFVLIGPQRDDLAAELGAQWLPLRPGTDTAAMLAMAQVLLSEERYDKAFIERYTHGATEFFNYLSGKLDGVVKTPEWAAALCGIDANTLRHLAREMPRHKTLINLAWSLQRSRYGEQPLWAGLALAAMIGQIGLPDGGFGHGYGAVAGFGAPRTPWPLPTLAQGHNPIADFIPVARVADMLLHPGGAYDYAGEQRRYPLIKLVYWAGGNPFHHHQDLRRLSRAFAQVDSLIVHEAFWTATAQHADLVLPCTTHLERDDLVASREDRRLRWVQAVCPPLGESRDDHTIFQDIAAQCGAFQAFSEGLSTPQWLRKLYEHWQRQVAPHPTLAYEVFQALGECPLPAVDEVYVSFAEFRADPIAHPLRTPSGRIELFSSRLQALGYSDCPAHPCWLGPGDVPEQQAATYPLSLIANNPASRLHSQLDHGAFSQASKIQGREPLSMHPQDARERGLAAGQVVCVSNHRGRILAGLRLSEQIRPGCVQLATGAWYEPGPVDSGVHCVHGNVNVLTSDVASSSFSQGCSGQLTRVQVSPWNAPLPPTHAHCGPPRRKDS